MHTCSCVCLVSHSVTSEGRSRGSASARSVAYSTSSHALVQGTGSAKDLQGRGGGVGVGEPGGHVEGAGCGWHVRTHASGPFNPP